MDAEADRPSLSQPRVAIFTLGRFEIVIEGRPLSAEDMARRKPLTLLKLLVAAGTQGAATDKLGDAIWPDADGDTTRNRLGVTLSRLRRLIGEDAVVTADSTLRLHSAICRSDTTQLLELQQRIERASGTKVSTEEAKVLGRELLALYQGRFLPGDAHLLAVLSLQQSLHQQFLSGAQTLARSLNGSGEHTEAVALCEGALRVDPVAEELYAELMESHAALGELSAAMRAFDRCVEMLDREHHIKPSLRMRERVASLKSLSARVVVSAAPQSVAGTEEPSPFMPVAPTQTDLGGETASDPDLRPVGSGERQRLTRRRLLVAAGTVTTGAVAAGASWYLTLGPGAERDPMEILARDGFPRYRQGTLAVLPIHAITLDSGESALADALRERLTTILSDFPGMVLSSLAAVQAVEGARLPTAELGRRLGVDYLLEGSLERVEARLRLSVRLVEAATGVQSWAGSFAIDPVGANARYDGPIVAICKHVLIGTVYGRVSAFETRAFGDDPAGWLEYMNAVVRRRLDTRNDASDIVTRLEAMRRRYPDNPYVLTSLAWRYMEAARYHWTRTPDRYWRIAVQYAERASEQHSSEAIGHHIRAFYHCYHGNWDAAEYDIERHVRYVSDDPYSHRFYAEVLLYLGKTEACLAEIKKSAQMMPAYPAHVFTVVEFAYYVHGDYERAAAASTVALERDEARMVSWIVLAASEAAQGNLEQAHAAAEKLMLMIPRFTAARHARVRFRPFRDPYREDAFREHLIAAGFPSH